MSKRDDTGATARDALESLIVGGVVAELLLIAAIDYTSFGHMIFGTAGLFLAPWLVALAFLPTLLVVDRIAKRAVIRQA